MQWRWQRSPCPRREVNSGVTGLMHVQVPSERSPKPCEMQRAVRTHTAHVSVAVERGGQCVAVPLTHELAAVCPFSAQEFWRLAEAPASGRLSPQAGSLVLPPVGTSCSHTPGAKCPDRHHLLTLPLPRSQWQQLAIVRPRWDPLAMTARQREEYLRHCHLLTNRVRSS